MKYPVAETFVSIQGEGVWTGHLMLFVRLAGCNVGEYKDDALLMVKSTDTHSVCTTCLGEEFVCDTDYHAKDRLSVEDIGLLADKSRVSHLCITGGEPFLHDLTDFQRLQGVTIHVETSGTRPIVDTPSKWWITCSPKLGYLPVNNGVVDEWKFLVGPNFDVEKVKHFLLANSCGQDVYLQPINGIDEPDQEAVERVLGIIRANPSWILSAQLHKYIKQR